MTETRLMGLEAAIGSSRPDDRGETCVRCGGTARLILDDGPTRCLICVMAWTRFACLVTEGHIVVEPAAAALDHADHREPRPDCPRCHRRLGPSEPVPGRFGGQLRRWL